MLIKMCKKKCGGRIGGGAMYKNIYARKMRIKMPDDEMKTLITQAPFKKLLVLNFAIAGEKKKLRSLLKAVRCVQPFFFLGCIHLYIEYCIFMYKPTAKAITFRVVSEI